MKPFALIATVAIVSSLIGFTAGNAAAWRELNTCIQNGTFTVLDWEGFEVESFDELDCWH